MALIMLSYSVNPFAVEEKGKLDNLYLTLPVTRQTIVTARYGLSLFLELTGLICGALWCKLSYLVVSHTSLPLLSFKPTFTNIYMLFCSSLLMYAIMNLSIFPILFRIGYAKGKTLGFYLPIGIFTVLCYALFIMFYFLLPFRKGLIAAFTWVMEYNLLTSGIMLMAAFLILLLSYRLSQRLYATREL
jgi:hypothetical protein